MYYSIFLVESERYRGVSLRRVEPHSATTLERAARMPVYLAASVASVSGFQLNKQRSNLRFFAYISDFAIDFAIPLTSSL